MDGKIQLQFPSLLLVALIVTLRNTSSELIQARLASEEFTGFPRLRVLMLRFPVTRPLAGGSDAVAAGEGRLRALELVS